MSTAQTSPSSTFSPPPTNKVSIACPYCDGCISYARPTLDGSQLNSRELLLTRVMLEHNLDKSQIAGLFGFARHRVDVIVDTVCQKLNADSVLHLRRRWADHWLRPVFLRQLNAASHTNL